LTDQQSVVDNARLKGITFDEFKDFCLFLNNLVLML
jgi:hypothetical protein